MTESSCRLVAGPPGKLQGNFRCCEQAIAALPRISGLGPGCRSIGVVGKTAESQSQRLCGQRSRAPGCRPPTLRKLYLRSASCPATGHATASANLFFGSRPYGSRRSLSGPAPPGTVLLPPPTALQRPPGKILLHFTASRRAYWDTTPILKTAQNSAHPRESTRSHLQTARRRESYGINVSCSEQRRVTPPAGAAAPS